jgi:hypothetical protein
MSIVAPVLESAPAAVQSWRELYKAAIAETDRNRLPSRINEAETALARRARELFAMGGRNTEEREAVDRALYTLRALSYCLKLETSYGQDRQKRLGRNASVREKSQQDICVYCVKPITAQQKPCKGMPYGRKAHLECYLDNGDY